MATEVTGMVIEEMRKMVSSVIGTRPYEAQQVYPGSGGAVMIRKLASGEYRLFAKKKDPRTGKRKNLGTFSSRAAAEKHERAVQYFKRAG